MQFNIGMCGGVYDPLHLGHKSLIIQAANQCKKLFVILSVSNGDRIPYQLRYRWLKQMVSDMENVEVLMIKDDSEDKEHYDWKKGCEDVRRLIGGPIDAVFVGSDYNYPHNPFSVGYPNAKIIYFDRDKVDISSTKLREDVYTYWDYLAPEAREYFVKKVVVLGSESCGKSTLVRNLAKYYSTEYVEEKGREVCDFAGGIDNMIPSDFIEILYKHKVDEIDRARKANKVLFIDTECYVTDYYLKLQFEGVAGTEKEVGDISALAHDIGRLNKYDLVLYLEPDVPWVQDGTRTYGEDSVRQENDKKLKGILQSAGLEYHVIRGDYQDRFKKAVQYVDEMFKLS